MIYTGANTAADNADPDYQEEMSTCVIILRVHQHLLSPQQKDVWTMWEPHETRKEVATEWPSKRVDVQKHVESIFHPKIFGVEPHAVATISVRA